MNDSPFGLLIITIGLLSAIVTMAFGNSIRTADIAALELRLDKVELALAAKIPAKIKFYTVPGYACDTSEIPGHCTNMWSLTQAAYDKDFFKEVGQ